MQCIVFTNSLHLAAKYRASQQDVLAILNKNLVYQQIVEFQLLDVSDYQDEFGEKPTWQEHKAIIADFMAGMGLQPSPKLSLFIVGGDDVIPMPRISNPINESVHRGSRQPATSQHCARQDGSAAKQHLHP